jgi:hypothetical protein
MRLSFFFSPFSGSQVLPNDLAGGGHRKGFDGFNEAWIYVSGEPVPDKILNVVFERFIGSLLRFQGIGATKWLSVRPVSPQGRKGHWPIGSRPF